mgnify:CR=1 FL=1
MKRLTFTNGCQVSINGKIDGLEQLIIKDSVIKKLPEKLETDSKIQFDNCDMDDLLNIPKIKIKRPATRVEYLLYLSEKPKRFKVKKAKPKTKRSSNIYKTL